MMPLIFKVLILLVSMSTIQSQDSADPPELVIYFTDPSYRNVPGQIVRVHLHHMNFTTLPIPNLTSPDAIHYDQTHEKVYWTDTSLKQIRRAGPFGEQDTLIAQLSNSSYPSGITLDSSTRQVFFTDMGENTIERIEMDTLNRTVIVSTDLTDPNGIVAHTGNKKLYWVDSRSDKKIQSCDYDGQNRMEVTTTTAIRPHGIALDQKTNRLYWADGAGHIESILTDGSSRRRVYTEQGVIFNDITLFNGYLYMTMTNYFFLVAMPEDGRHLSILHSKRFQFPRGIHAFSPNFNVTKTCDNGRYGANCIKCGNCVDDDICEKTTGICLAGCKAGYKSDLCKENCEAGTYGKSCDNTCGGCRPGTVCDIYTGKCPSGCRFGFMGDNCDYPCGPNTYGNPCQECGKCLGGERCDGGTGNCPNGCQDGWEGAQCNQPCGKNTYGPCIPCGYCADGASCDSRSGYCNDGCEPGYEGLRCNIVTQQKQQGIPTGLAVGLGVGLTFIVLAIAGVLLFVFILKRKAFLSQPTDGPVVKMERVKTPEAKENEYTSIENVGTTPIIAADELSHQTEIMHQNETHSTA